MTIFKEVFTIFRSYKTIFINLIILILMSKNLYAIPSMSNLILESNKVNLYEKLQISFDIDNSAAENVYFPYDGGNIPGLPEKIGITVEGVFLPPSQTTWDDAIIQPAFWHQPMAVEPDEGGDVVYPVGQGRWMIRFAPKLQGTWKVKIRFQDRSVCQDTYPCDIWVESAPQEFEVAEPLPGNHGFVEISPYDSRYFRFTDGTPFHGLGHQTSLIPVQHGQDALSEAKQNQVDLMRAWMSASLITGRGTHGWDPWRGYGHPDRIGTGDGVPGVPYGYHDFSIKLEGNGDYIFMTTDGNQYITGSLEANKTYVVRARVKLVNVLPASTGSEPNGLVVKLLYDPYRNFLSSGNTVRYLIPQGATGTKDWYVVEGRFTNTLGKRKFSWGSGLAVGLQNVTSGTAYLDEIYIGEDLGNGQIGPNVVFKGQFNYHMYFDQIASALWDNLIEKSEQDNVYLKLVVLEKNDPIYNSIDPETGIFKSSYRDQFSKWNEFFYAAPNTKVRRLHEYYWRYISARWGYSTAIHSWELLNEGDPFNGNHYDQANAFARSIKTWDGNHLASTSFWHSFPGQFWKDTSLDYADVHAYVSTSYAPEDAKQAMQHDAAYYHIWHSQTTFDQSVGKPVIRGEAGLDFPDRQERNPELQQDTQGIWYHNFLWSGLHTGGLYELYWWIEDMVDASKGYDHRPEMGRFKNFLADLRLEQGDYEDWGGAVDNLNLRVVGQKNLIKGRAHLWIQNKQHTWKHVVDGLSITPASGSVTIDGLPAGQYTVEWWDTYQGDVIKTENTIAKSSLVLTLPGALSSDIAVKVYLADPAPAPPQLRLPQ